MGNEEVNQAIQHICSMITAIVDELLPDKRVQRKLVVNLTDSFESNIYVLVDDNFVGCVVGKEGRAANAIRELAKRVGKLYDKNLIVNLHVKSILKEDETHGQRE